MMMTTAMTMTTRDVNKSVVITAHSRVLLALLLLMVLQPLTVSSVELKVESSCSETIWVQTAPNSHASSLVSGDVVKLHSGQQVTFQVPSSGWSGRLWPKIGCDSSGQDCLFGQSSPPCPSGGCHPPADSKAEIFWPANFAGMAWYDVSLVDGYSLPIRLAPSSPSCTTAECAVPLGSCPSNEISGLGDLSIHRSGKLVGCLAPCKKWNYPYPYGQGQFEDVSHGLMFCCPSPPVTPQECSSGPVISTEYVKLLRSNCPNAYSYAYDDANGLHTCDGSTSFTVTFCPSGSTSTVTQPGPSTGYYGGVSPINIGSPADSCSTACLGANPSEPCYYDPSCSSGGLGCNALAKENCRFCGFGAFSGISCP